ncbi:MAG: UDP-N-acetylmuramoyl-L-alanine--D-glutamate ligase [Candidatus Nealsonbacteria bacterium CG10_big_fil_rev_8_21_14_0_10_36_24]|uniref:UDP-N-acetylmuramoylalanine--D-glutamate ligase n=2 Tax=Candidatus Nealsoniibacteriota TaxID=1817911 RepID=A0A2H0YP76_9BACT|nr:MAG: UDP-N-acetylmuramoyl-L-alanine--D-glutamate ligase [Candidatus Nealsonbacteria bacterium CG10_big_fil_rev_8_21_14_0_10_36_24]PIS40295.1 MAG: UDP-N-acetylmuramoyl-L-alanine--D-glutamate ligase [Candidatus Nealsonbacteria bacterium CG08_land_8_20_14_0_20_36_22]
MRQIFKDKKITIMGLGLLGGGVGVAKFFAKQGAKVLVTDLKTKRELKPSLEKLRGLPIKFILNKHRNQDFINTGLVIKNPAVKPDSPYLKIAKKHNIPIKTDISIFFDLCKGTIIGVTGTKGKSTTATLIYLLLKTKYPNTLLAGNIGLTPLEILSKIKKNSKVVLELSSFELENLKKSPHIAVITTLFPDHLNRYKNFNDYVEAKKPIFKYQKKNDILVLNYDNLETKKLAKEASSKVLFFRSSNVSAAILVAKIFKISKKSIKKVLSDFKGIPNRQELIATKKSVKYINDTTATTPQSVILALKRFSSSKIILIAGGQDKNLNYENLAKEIKINAKHLILLPGTASDKIKKELKKFKKIFLAKSMRDAVKKATAMSQKGDIVLLSPGAASFTPLEVIKTKKKHKVLKPLTGFNLFKNEFDRGEQFIKETKKL